MSLIMLQNAMEMQAQSEIKLCEIKWSALSDQEWNKCFYNIKRSNLLQSDSYVRTMAQLDNQKQRRGVIEIDGNIAGLIQILEAGILNNAVHGVIVDRAPLWLDGYGSAQDFEMFLKAFTREFPKRFGRRIRFIPEMENNVVCRELLQKYGYKSSNNHGYQTIWLDIRPELDLLRKKLNPKWRNKLVKSEKRGLDITFGDATQYFPWLIKNYAKDKALRGYDGASPKIITALVKEFSRGENMLLGTALLEGEPIAAILIFIHGSSSTYQIGYTSDSGRANCAHNLLLWRAVEELKAGNITDFDLGGVNDESAKNVKTFKEGLGGKLYETLGIYH